jgi:hypothetical protein
MHQNAVYFAIQRALERLHLDVVGAPEGISKIKMMVRDIVAEIAEARILYVRANED